MSKHVGPYLTGLRLFFGFGRVTSWPWSENSAALATLQREDLDGLFVAPDSLFSSRRAQIVTLAARDRIPAAYTDREIVAAGGLMNYGADIFDMYRQLGVYADSILKGVQAGRPAGPTIDQVRFRHQPQDRQCARAGHSGDAESVRH
jgi:hypothetical protein